MDIDRSHDSTGTPRAFNARKDLLTPIVRERLARLALASELNNDLGDELGDLISHIASVRICNPDLAGAIHLLQSNLENWRRAHELLATASTKHAILYEDCICTHDRCAGSANG